MIGKITPVPKFRTTQRIKVNKLALSLLLVASPLSAFPEMFKFGYQTCSTCHISPNGGGALTPYGRNQAAEILSTWSYKGEESVGHYDWGQPEWLILGGDARYINMMQETDTETVYRHLAMQRDVELGVSYGGFVITGSGGQYYDRVNETRRHYLSYQREFFSIRSGKFIPAYGINAADHNAFSRTPLSLGQGDESYNTEAAITSKIGQVFLTQINYTKTPEKKYTNENSGYALRATLFALKSLQIGASWMRMTVDEKRGGFMQASYGKWLYCGLDVNEVEDLDRTIGLYSYGKCSAEAYKGVNFTYENNYSKTAGISSRNNSVGLDFFPRPHFQFLGKMINTNGKNGFLLLSHYYL